MPRGDEMTNCMHCGKELTLTQEEIASGRKYQCLDCAIKYRQLYVCPRVLDGELKKPTTACRYRGRNNKPHPSVNEMECFGLTLKGIRLALATEDHREGNMFYEAGITFICICNLEE